MTTMNDVQLRAKRLGLHALAASPELLSETWAKTMLDMEERERQRRSLERRKRTAHLQAFKPLADFDWNWPRRIDRVVIEELFTFAFVDEGTNIVLLGPNGVGKTMIAHNLAHQALLKGHTVLTTTASDMLNDLAAQEGTSALGRRLRRYAHPAVLVVDEVGYLSYDNRHADLLFEIVSRRYREGKPLIITTNKEFKEWNQVFPNAASVVTLIDRLVHKAEIIDIDAESYRLKEATDRTTARARARKKPVRG